jgi:hypothetical protein
MYYAAHFDGRGAALMSDDVAAVCTLYPTGRTGSVSMRRFAIVADRNSPTPTDRLVVDGTLAVTEGLYHPGTDTLIVDLRAAGVPVYRLAVSPEQWRINPSRTRIRYRSITEAGITIMTVVIRDARTLRFRLRASRLNLSAAQAEPLVISLALGGTNASQTMTPLRSSGRARVYP